MPVTLNDAYDVRLTRDGALVTPKSASYMNRRQCEAWVKKNARPGDTVEIIRTMTGDVVVSYTVGQ